MERIYTFLPSVLIIACIAGVTRFYLKWVVKHFIKRFGNNIKSVEWHEKNKRIISWTVGTPRICVWAPAVEELIFRAPLIIAFNAVSSVAWYGIFASSGLFALLHWFGKKIWISDILSARENSDRKTDDVVTEMNRLRQEGAKEIVVRKVLHVVSTLPLGILAGYYGIKYQSIWVSFGIHSAWNIFMPIVISVLVSLVMIAVFIWERDFSRKRLM